MIYLLTGEEEGLARAWLDENLEKWVDAAWRPFNYHVVEAAKVPMEEFSGLLQSFPMGSTHRVVVVRDFDKLDAARKKKIPEHAARLLDTTILIFWFVPSPADPKKLALGKEWEEVIKSAEIKKFSLKKEEKQKWLGDSLKEKGINLTKEGESYLLEATGGNIGKLEMELEKIAAYSASAPAGKAEIEQLTAPAPPGDSSNTLYALLDGMAEKQSGKSLSALKTLIEQGEPPLRILAAMGSQVRILRQIKALLDERKTAQEIAKILGIHPFRVTKGMTHSKNFKSVELSRLTEWLARADWSIKTGKQEPVHVLELILARIGR